MKATIILIFITCFCCNAQAAEQVDENDKAQPSLADYVAINDAAEKIYMRDNGVDDKAKINSLRVPRTRNARTRNARTRSIGACGY